MTITPSKNDDPVDMMLALVGEMERPGAGIEAQEAAGQVQLVNSDVLPTEALYGAREALEAAGVRFGEPDPDDPLFAPVELPSGWRKERSDHSMWSHLIDGQGRRRAEIFYKAAFYDRRAHIMATQRFTVRFDYDHQDATGEAVSRVYDGQTVTWETEANPWDVEPEQDYDRQRCADKVASDWLDRRWPDWQDKTAYWSNA
ncbi:MAG: hypothetical protein GY926_18590 [bacterium]|nr:hypothetical protein [bacterium]